MIIPHKVPRKAEIEGFSTPEEFGRTIQDLINLKEVLSYMKGTKYPWTNSGDIFLIEAKGRNRTIDEIGRQLVTAVNQVIPASLQGTENINRIFGNLFAEHKELQHEAIARIMEAVTERTDGITITLDWIEPEDLQTKLDPDGRMA